MEGTGSMKPLLIATALLAATPAMLTTEVAVASPIQRCAAGGSVIYTDKVCKSIGAMAMPMSSELIRSLARVQSDVASADGTAAVPADRAEEIASAQAYLAARRNTGCARTGEQLALQLRGAVSMGDVNRIAASYNWAGMRSSQASSVMSRLEALGKSPVTAANYYNASIGDAAMMTMMPAALRSGGSAGFVQLVQGNGASVTEFDVQRVAGCYFVSF
jgi:hypothetical protein